MYVGLSVSAMSQQVTLSEIFGPTIQGEGPSTGTPAVFVRFGRCNLDCAWCDTPYTWDWKSKNGIVFDPKEELSRTTVDDIVASVLKAYRADLEVDARLVVITGGEPLVQRKATLALAVALGDEGFNVEIETNGTFRPLPAVARVKYNISPKLPSAGVNLKKALRPDILKMYLPLAFRGTACLKFVVQDDEDLAAARRLVEDLGWPHEAVWLMPEGREVDKIDKGLKFLNSVPGNKYQISDRLHVRLWGDERGH